MTTFIIISMLVAGFCYGRSKSWASVGRFTLVFLSAAASTTYILYLIGYARVTDFDPATIYSFTIIPLIIIVYFLLASTMICFVAWKKDGFKELLPLKQPGLLQFLVWVLIAILFMAVVGSLFGVATTTGDSLTGSLTGATIATLVVTLIGLLSTLMFAPEKEFERTTNLDEAEEEAYREKTRQDAKHQAKIDEAANQERAEAERQILIGLAEEEAHAENEERGKVAGQDKKCESPCD